MAPADPPEIHDAGDVLRARVEELTRELEASRAEAESLRFPASFATQAQEVVIGLDPEGRVLSWSLGAQRLYGHTAAQAVGCIVEELTLPPAERPHEATRRKEARTAGHWEGTVRQRGIDEASFWSRVSLSEVRDDAGGHRGYLRIDRDVTDETIAEQSLRESEQRLRTLIENSLDIIFELSASGQMRYISSRVEPLLGFQPSQLLGRSFRELVHSDDREVQDEHIRQVLRTAARVRSTMRLRDESGRWRWFECAAQGLAPSDEGPRAVIVARDITARRTAERAIHEQERRLRLMANALPVWIAYIDRDRRFGFNNATYERWFGIPAASTLGRTLWEVIGEGAYESVRSHVDAALEGRSPGFEIQIEDIDGAIRQTQVELIPHLDPDGTVLGFYGLVQDISARIQAAQRQDRLVRELDHRVKNTLATVVALAEETLISASSEADFREAFIARIHTMARSHEALARADWTGARLRELVENVLSPFFELGEHSLDVRGSDQVLRERAVLPLALSLHELAVRSLKHGALSFIDGRVRLEWLSPDRDELRVQWTETQTGKAPASEAEGVGLRLVEDLIRYELGGRVETHFDDPGRTWTITLPGDVVDWEREAGPTHSADAAPAASASTPSPLEPLGLRILVVEDDHIQTRLLKRLLERIGCVVVGPAGRVPDALDLVDEGHFDCAILDIDLAGVVSTPVAEKLGRLGKPYIFLTGYADSGPLPAMPVGIALLRKPVDLESLATALRRAALPH